MELVDHKNETSLYIQLKEKLVQELRSRNLKANERFLTFRDIAEQHEVSTITASKAISELVDEGILYCRQGKGTFVGDIDKIKRLFNKDVFNIGATFLDMYNVSSPYLSEVIKGISEGCNRFGYNLQIFATHAPDTMTIDNYVLMRNIKKKHIDGLLIASRMDLKDIILLRENNVPFVWIGNDLPHEKVYCVLVDHVYGTFLAIEHLLNLGHKRIGLIRTSVEAAIIPTYRVCLEKRGLKFDTEMIKESGEYTQETGYALMKELLNLSNPPTAVFIIDDIVALGAMKAIDEKGLRIPDDISIVGYGNHSAHLYSPVPLTTVDTHVRKMSVLSLEMLVKVMKGEEVKEPKLTITPNLIVRNSCGATSGMSK